MASIKHLDNPTLLRIFDRLSSQKLLTAGHVCVRWNAVQNTSSLARQELVLLIGNEAQSYIDESVLQVPERRLLVDDNGVAMFADNEHQSQLQIHSFPLDFATILNDYFENLTTLTISANDEHLNSIIHLLRQFNQPNGNRLHTLKLYSNQKYPYRQQNNDNNEIEIGLYANLLAAVNSIGSLTKLTFDVKTEFVSDSFNGRIDLPILANLDEFEFCSVANFCYLFDSITKYAVNNKRLKRIGIYLPTDDFTWLLALPTELSSCFTHLHIRLKPENISHFENLFRHFANLTSVEITSRLDCFTIFTLFRPLTHLHNLLSLVVDTCHMTLKRSSVHARGRVMHFELPSVKVFTIDINGWTDSHNFFQKCDMHRVFPNVQVVRVIRQDALCCACYKNLNETTEVSEALEENCARQMFRHFTQHSQHLRMVSSRIVGNDVVGSTRYRQWTWNQMESFEEEEEEVEEKEWHDDV